MPILKTSNGVVTEMWQDVETLKELKDKYGLEGSEFIVGEGAPGMLWDGTALSLPAPDGSSERDQRNELLRASDWTQLADAPAAQKAQWAAYRQLLRDLPAQAGFPSNVNWPTPPGSATE